MGGRGGRRRHLFHHRLQQASGAPGKESGVTFLSPAHCHHELVQHQHCSGAFMCSSFDSHYLYFSSFLRPNCGFTCSVLFFSVLVHASPTRNITPLHRGQSVCCLKQESATKPNVHLVPVSETKFTKITSDFWSACCQMR